MIESLESILKHRRLLPVFAAAQVLYQVQPVLGGRARAIMFKDGALTLQTDSSLKASQLKLSEMTLIQEMNERLGKEIVKRIKFKIGD